MWISLVLEVARADLLLRDCEAGQKRMHAQRSALHKHMHMRMCTGACGLSMSMCMQTCVSMCMSTCRCMRMCMCTLVEQTESSDAVDLAQTKPPRMNPKTLLREMLSPRP